MWWVNRRSSGSGESSGGNSDGGSLLVAKCALHVDATYLTLIELTMWPCLWLCVCVATDS